MTSSVEKFSSKPHGVKRKMFLIITMVFGFFYVVLFVYSSPSDFKLDVRVQAASDNDNNVNVMVAQDTKILCWVLTSPQSFKEKAIHVRNTWGKRCNKLLFMSSSNDANPEVIALPNTDEGRDWLWAKTKEAFKYVWTHHRNDADWFMKADDDTFVIVENLRLMLRDYNTNHPVWFGSKFYFKEADGIENEYMAGGPGYVLSKEALSRFINVAIPDTSICRENHEGDEDVLIGQCLIRVGVDGIDTRDKLGRYRFLQFPAETHVNTKLNASHWYWGRIFYPQKKGMECCSDRAVSFHKITPDQMYMMEYLIYHLQHYGVS